MKAFIKALDEKAWRAIMIGWVHPTKTDDDGNIIPKLEETWFTIADRLANYNCKALSTIFNVVDANQFELISTCKSTKAASKILETTYEGTSAVKVSKALIIGYSVRQSTDDAE